jgi:hypothetical protein
MKALVTAAMLISLVACSKSDEIRDSVAGPKGSPVTGNTPPGVATASEVPNSVAPEDSQLGGGIRH